MTVPTVTSVIVLANAIQYKAPHFAHNNADLAAEDSPLRFQNDSSPMVN